MSALAKYIDGRFIPLPQKASKIICTATVLIGHVGGQTSLNPSFN
jgi:hypothetical protein